MEHEHEDAAGKPAPSAGGGDGTARRTAAGRRRPVLLAAGGVALAAILAVVLFAGIGSSPSTSDVAPGISPRAAQLLQLETLSATSGNRPPDFTLTDQHGARVSLSQFRGKVVLLSFNDDRCVDLCPLYAQDVVAADRDLGSAATHVVFLSVNVNPFYPRVRDVRQWTDQHGLGHVANWVSTTGPVPRLTAIRKRYGVYLQVDHKTRTVSHGTELFFIDPAGREVAIGEFGTNAADTLVYAHAIAQMADDLLPAAQRGSVGGPSLAAPTRSDAAVAAPGPSFSLPLLTDPHTKLSSSALHGHYTVLNFWSSTCTACKQEMAGVEQAYQALGTLPGKKKVDFVGVDVSDRRHAALAFARAAGITYPVVSDTTGTLSGAYQISGPPYTVVLGPRGTVLIRHPGSLTALELEYLVKSNDPKLGGS